MISSFFKKKEVRKRGPVLTTDIHSHLIPGIDDGSKNMEESLHLLKGMEGLGYKKVITTPHIMLDAYQNTPEIIRNGLNDLRLAAKKLGINIEIEAGAEYYLDEGLFDHLQSNDVMSIAGKYLLFETSYISKPIQMEEMIFEISSAGYVPVLAHPERYRYIKNKEKEFGRLKELGVLFQVNLNSFGGHYGKGAKNHAEYLSENGLIDFLGSDIHHKKQVETLEGIFYSEVYKEIFIHNSIRNSIL